MEAGGPKVEPVGPVRSVGNEVEAEFAVPPSTEAYASPAGGRNPCPFMKYWKWPIKPSIVP